jgi:hypothetical protein
MLRNYPAAIQRANMAAATSAVANYDKLSHPRDCRCISCAVQFAIRERTKAMMNTNVTQAQTDAIRASKPGPAATNLPNAPAALQKIDMMARLVAATEGQLEATRQVRSLLGLISGKLENLEDRIEHIENILAAASLRQAAQPATNGNNGHADIAQDIEIMNASSIEMSYDPKSGKPNYKVIGDKWPKFGVRVWPEILPALGVDVAAIAPGKPLAWAEAVRVQVEVNAEGKRCPRKVIGLAK